MKGSLKLSLAIALALSAADVMALGLGQIQIKSGLNEPLNAEIPVLTGAPGEAAGLHVDLASNEDFARVGLNRARITLPLEFAVGTNARGDTVIKISTKDIVREPFLDFLVEVNWSKGKLLREYTVLLDPPVMAPAVKGSAATSAPVKDHEAAVAQKLPDNKSAKGKSKPSDAPKVEPAKTAPTKVATEPKQPKAKPAAPAPAVHNAPSGSDYGPVAQGETLGEIARATRPDETTNINQMMLAVLKSNPNAFYKDNINALKRGAVLRIPTPDEIKATASMKEAAAAVREQNAAWSGGTATPKPTLVATTGASTKTPAVSTPKEKTEKPSTTKTNERLALVPPRSGKDSKAMAEHPGVGSNGSSGAEKAELARTKETLAAREQETGELKSRVKELEELKGKNDRLVTLKDSEIAELQHKLKELQDAERKSASAAVASTASANKVTQTPVSAASTEPATSKPADSLGNKPAEPAKPVDTTSATAKNDKITAQDIWGGDAAATKTPADGKPSTTAPAANPMDSSTTAATTTTTPSSANNSVATTPESPVSGPSAESAAGNSAANAPSTTAPAAASAATNATNATANQVPAVPPPAPALQPWYLNPITMYAGGGGLLLLGLLALTKLMRRPKPMPVMNMDEAYDYHDEEPMHGNDERSLLEQIEHHPHDAALHLQLLNLYYAERDVAKFEAAAETMYGNIADPTQPEWQRARAMGEELAPHNPLFGGEQDLSTMAGHHHDQQDDYADGGFADATTEPHGEVFDFNEPNQYANKPVEDDFDFALTDPVAAKPDTAHEDLAFDLPPPVVAPPPAAPRAAPAPMKSTDEEFFSNEDAIGTKLDLAKAYLDMGDPEGARSMLDEVLAEGNDEQKKEARRLISDIK